MERRTFLKIIGLGAVLAGIGSLPLSKLALAETTNPEDALIREMVGYDPKSEINYVRYDILTDTRRFWVAMPITNSDDIPSYRPKALEVLREKMKKENIKLSDLRPLEIPTHMKGGYVPLGA